jgi:hypothetical protein
VAPDVRTPTNRRGQRLLQSLGNSAIVCVAGGFSWEAPVDRQANHNTAAKTRTVGCRKTLRGQRRFFMKRRCVLLPMLALLGFPPVVLGNAVVDQSFTTGNNLTTIINDCCAYVAQTYTAGLTGTLSSIRIDTRTHGFADPLSLDIQTRSVSLGLPTSTILGDVVFAGTPSFADEISFASEHVPQIAGEQYAIVVHYIGAPPPGHPEGRWDGAVGDLYPEGADLLSFDGGLLWVGIADGFDSHFVTIVDIAAIPEPSTNSLAVAGMLGALILVLFARRARAVELPANPGPRPAVLSKAASCRIPPLST